MGALWSYLYGPPEDGKGGTGPIGKMVSIFTPPPEPPKPMTGKEKFKLMCRNHWRGIVGVIALLVLIPVAWLGAVKYKFLYVWLAMISMWFIQPVPPYAVGVFPIVALPLMGIQKSADVCINYMNEHSALWVVSTMMWSIFNDAGLNKRFFLWMVKSRNPSMGRVVSNMFIATALMSVLSQRNLVTETVVPLAKEILIHLSSVGYPAAVAEDKATNFATKIYSSIVAASNVGTLLLMPGSLPVLNILAQLTTINRTINHFPQLEYMAISGPVVGTLFIFNYAYFLIMIGAKSIQLTEIQKRDFESFIKEKQKSLGAWTNYQIFGIIAIVFTLGGLFGVNPGFGLKGWGKLINKRENYIRETVVIVAMVVLLHSIPYEFPIIKYFTKKKEKDLPPKRAWRTVMAWRKTNAATSWESLILMGGCCAMISASETSKFKKSMQDLLKRAGNLHLAVVMLLVSLTTGVLTNMIHFLAATGIVMPVVHACADGMNLRLRNLAIVCGFASAFTSIALYTNTANYALKQHGVKYKNLLKYTTASTFVSCLILFGVTFAMTYVVK